MHHTNTRIYRRSLELIDITREIMAQLPTGYGFLADQLRRASSSVVLNYAEGCGHQSTGQRRRFFAIARGSALEVSAAVEVAHRFGVVNAALHERTADLCDHISAMLYRYR